jgi:hypothetical protein
LIRAWVSNLSASLLSDDENRKAISSISTQTLTWGETYKVFEDLIGFLVLKNWNKRAPEHAYNHTLQLKI